jgi:hypothetical protein
MIDETSRRKPNFDEPNSVPVVLADGQAWYVPKPWVELWPRFEAGVARTTYPLLTCGPRLDALIGAVSDAIGDAGTYGELLAGAATLGAWMLLTQYELSDADLDTLFCGRPLEPDSWDWVTAVFEVATGRNGPKAYRGGGA